MANSAVSRGRPTSPGANGRAVVAQDPFEAGADAADGVTTALVAGVRRQRHADHAPALEGVGQQQQLGLGVDRRALGVGRQPGAADLDLVRLLPAAPPAQLHEPRAADEATVGDAALGEGDGGAGVALGEQAGDVARRRVAAVGHLGEAVRRALAGGRLGQRDGVLGRQRQQFDVAAVERERREHHHGATVPGSTDAGGAADTTGGCSRPIRSSRPTPTGWMCSTIGSTG